MAALKISRGKKRFEKSTVFNNIELYMICKLN